ncbi:MAG TPA: SRPBCC family protein [Candidatus Hydrogenedentes bacterium]|nr:SRPBCC family protein [Candidatus Hydrogenedentota bacterium]HNT88012.1 SRPBCC family protein [Candidatus Hydrogenedentota bacterium]
MPSATRTETFDVSPDVFYQVIVDYKLYPEFADNVVKTQVLKVRDDGARVKFFVHLIREFNYTLDLYHDPLKRVHWNLVRGDLFSKMDGSWDLKKRGKRKVEVTYSLDIEPKLFVPRMIINRLVSYNLPRVMTNFYERARALETAAS